MVSGDEIIEDGGDHRHPQEEVPQHAWPSQAARDPVYNKDGREVGRPHAYREDVGGSRHLDRQLGAGIGPTLLRRMRWIWT